MATYTIALSDTQEVQRYGTLRLLSSSSPWILAAAVLSLWLSRFEPGLALFLSGMAVAWLLATLWALRSFGVRLAMRWMPYDKPITITISEDSIRMEHQFGSSVLPKTLVIGAHQFRKSFALDLATGSALVIPRAILTPEEDAILATWARRRR